MKKSPNPQRLPPSADKVAYAKREVSDHEDHADQHRSPRLGDVRGSHVFYSIDLRDPSGDGKGFAIPGGDASAAYSADAQATADVAALGEKIGDLITLAPHFDHLCSEVVRLGGTPAACFAYLSSPVSTDTVYHRLYDMQSLIAEYVVNASFDFDPTFAAKLSAIAANSTCLPHVWVGWTPTASRSSISYDLTVNAPASMLIDAAVSVVPNSGELAFFADGSRLESGIAWDSEAAATKSCTRGDVKILSYLKFDSSHNLQSAVLRQGWKDTCSPGGDQLDEDTTTLSFTDFAVGT